MAQRLIPRLCDDDCLGLAWIAGFAGVGVECTRAEKQSFDNMFQRSPSSARNEWYASLDLSSVVLPDQHWTPQCQGSHKPLFNKSPADIPQHLPTIHYLISDVLLGHVMAANQTFLPGDRFFNAEKERALPTHRSSTEKQQNYFFP